jgi:GMP reductase
MKLLKYQDICLTPKYSDCASRSECNTSVSLSKEDSFKLPIVPANMKSVIDEGVARWLSENNYFYVMHRFDIDIVSFVREANKENWKTISISIGVQKEDERIVKQISNENLRVDYITIDIAHGHCEKMKKMIKFLRQESPACFIHGCKIIAGNVATGSAVRDLYGWGASIVKVGIGQGSPCTTKDKTGFTMPMFSCVQKCSGVHAGMSDDKIPIIADGSVTSSGDIAKAIRAGALMVMSGSLFVGCSDSPAKITLCADGLSRKAYLGSSSAENKGHNNHVEGVRREIGVSNLSYSDKLAEIKQDLQSAISYAGGGDLSALLRVDYEIIT